MPSLAPHDLPEQFDTGKPYSGEAAPFNCSLDITRLMKVCLFETKELLPGDMMDAGTCAFADYVQDRSKPMSSYDGGQLMYNFVADGKSILFNTQLGVHEGVAKCLTPKPSVSVLGAGG
ncbi:hypothetical protein LY76DRAFT_648932 [Colletotrichum caudatum]|nr:hypothetical protein LY76DRAFT_648932 [Colletotrichum caudatum]